MSYGNAGKNDRLTAPRTALAAKAMAAAILPSSKGVWTPDMVKAALTKAWRIIEATTSRPGPRYSRIQLPDYFDEWEDRVAAAAKLEERIAEKSTRQIREAHMMFTPQELEMAEAALSWDTRFLVAGTDEWRAFDLWRWCRTHKAKWSEFVGSLGVSLATANRWREKALQAIADGLNG